MARCSGLMTAVALLLACVLLAGTAPRVSAAVPNHVALANAQTLAYVAHNMYAASHGLPQPSAEDSYSDCARKHAAANGLQTTIASSLAKHLGTKPSNVEFVDLNAPATTQFCHAAVVYVPAGAKNGLSLPKAGQPAIVVSFRGSSNIAAALTDVQGFTPVSHTFRGQSVEVHRGILASVLKHAPGTSCRPLASAPQPSCAESIQGAINDLISTHKIATPAQVLITGHSLGAAQAALLALYLDDSSSASKYDLHAYTYGQPMFGLGKDASGGGASFRDAYGRLNDRLIRVVHNADPVTAIASTCQRGKSLKRPYEHVGTLVRVISRICAKNVQATPKGETRPAGRCAEVVTGATATCTIQPHSWKDVCSIWVGEGTGTSKDNKCYCSQEHGSEIPTALVSPSGEHNLWGSDGGDHASADYLADIMTCGGLTSISKAASLPLDSTCAKKPFSHEEICKDVHTETA